MRSVLYIVMLAVCLIAWECFGTANGSQSEEKDLNGENGDILTTTATTAVQVNSQPEPQSDGKKTQPQLADLAPVEPEPAVVEEGVLESGDENTDEEGEQEADEEEEITAIGQSDNPHNKGKAASSPSPQPPTSLLITQPGQPSAGPPQQQQQLQQQSQLPQQIPRQVSVKKDEGTGGTSQNQNHAAPTRTSEDELDTSHILPHAKTPDARTGQPEHQAPEPRPEEQHSPSSHSTGGGVTQTKEMQPKTEKQTDNAPSGRSPPQGQPPTQPTIKSKTPVNDTTTSVGGAAPAEKQHVPPKKPTPISTPAADNAVHQTDTTTRDKETHTEQTSVTFTSEPVKGQSTPPVNNSGKLSQALQSLDNKDASIGGSLVCALSALATLVLVAGAPPPKVVF